MVQQQQTIPIPNAVHTTSHSIDAPTNTVGLRDIVLGHKVCYEVWPEWSGCGGRSRRNGYSVIICGVNGPGECVGGHHIPGCAHCALTYDRLRKIAEWITRIEQPACRLEIQTFDRAWHIAPRQRWSRYEITVSVKILHYRNFDGAVDDAQERCLSHLRILLKELGISEGIWPGATTAAH